MPSTIPGTHFSRPCSRSSAKEEPGQVLAPSPGKVGPDSQQGRPRPGRPAHLLVLSLLSGTAVNNGLQPQSQQSQHQRCGTSTNSAAKQEPSLQHTVPGWWQPCTEATKAEATRPENMLSVCFSPGYTVNQVPYDVAFTSC